MHMYLLYPRKSHDIRPNVNKPIGAVCFIYRMCQQKGNKWLKFGFSNMCDFILNKDLLMNMHYEHIFHARIVKLVAIYRLYSRKMRDPFCDLRRPWRHRVTQADTGEWQRAVAQKAVLYIIKAKIILQCALDISRSYFFKDLTKYTS